MQAPSPFTHTATAATATQSFWQAPLVPVAAAFSAGILLDRIVPVERVLFLVLAFPPLLLWLRRRGQGVFLLWAAAFFLGAAYHSWRVRDTAADSVRRFDELEEAPVRLEGRVESEPQRSPALGDAALRTAPIVERATFLVRCRRVLFSTGNVTASGFVQVFARGDGAMPQRGQTVELIGTLHWPDPPANPGGIDRRRLLADQGIAATFNMEDPNAWRLLEAAAPMLRPALWVAWLRARAQELVEEYIPAAQQGVALALLLGDGTRLASDDWDAYLNTGVVHVLAISGQHLVVLAWFLTWMLRLGHVTRRQAALGIWLFLLVYACVTGGRPPVMRAAWMAAALVGAGWLRRPVSPANTFALAWILVAAYSPADIFQVGCQLSFLATAVLLWASPPAEEPDPLAQLLAEQRPLLVRLLMDLGRSLGKVYLVNLWVWIALTPLIGARLNLVTPIAVVIGPPAVFLTAAALITGFLALLLGALLPFVGYAFGWVTGLLLGGCQDLVQAAARVPGGHAYVHDVPVLWVYVFYIGLAVFLTVPAVRAHRRLFLSAACVWLGLGWAGQLWPRSVDGFRCTFLAVGHGGCIVLETSEGSVLVYDAGAITGPEVTRQHVAPFLWSRRIRHIDELVISHADLDHFNGVPALLERFSVGRVTLTPSFAQRDAAGVRLALTALEGKRVPQRIVKRGDRWKQDAVEIEVLHPPATGPEGKENARSMVLAVRSDSLHLLLTGDLEDQGLGQLLALKQPPIDVLMAPHHGSPKSNTAALAAWARPQAVVSCQGRPRSGDASAYASSIFLTTWEHGAVTVRFDNGRKIIEAFKTSRRWELK